EIVANPEPRNSAVTTSTSPAPPSRPVVSSRPLRQGYPESFRRIRSPIGAENLKEELEFVPEILLEPTPGAVAAKIQSHALENPGSWKKPAGLPWAVAGRLRGLPERKDADCYLFDIQAKSLEALSERLHQYL